MGGEFQHAGSWTSSYTGARMESPESRASRWLGILADLLNPPLSTFPHAEICQELMASFDVAAISWDWRDSEGNLGFDIFPPDPAWRSQEFLRTWQNPEFV